MRAGNRRDTAVALTCTDMATSATSCRMFARASAAFASSEYWLEHSCWTSLSRADTMSCSRSRSCSPESRLPYHGAANGPMRPALASRTSITASTFSWVLAKPLDRSAPASPASLLRGLDDKLSTLCSWEREEASPAQPAKDSRAQHNMPGCQWRSADAAHPARACVQPSQRRHGRWVGSPRCRLSPASSVEHRRQETDLKVPSNVRVQRAIVIARGNMREAGLQQRAPGR